MEFVCGREGRRTDSLYSRVRFASNKFHIHSEKCYDFLKILFHMYAFRFSNVVTILKCSYEWGAYVKTILLLLLWCKYKFILYRSLNFSIRTIIIIFTWQINFELHIGLLQIYTFVWVKFWNINAYISLKTNHVLPEIWKML